MTLADTTLPVATDSQLLKQVETIAEEIREKRKTLVDAGLLGGKAGIALLFAYMAKALPGTNFPQTTYDFLDDLATTLSQEAMGYNMSGGVAGIAFVFQHLRNIGLIGKEDDFDLTEIDAFLEQGIEADAASGNWDPLHGMTGIGVYFLERFEETGETKYLERIVSHLSSFRIQNGEYKIWMTPGYGKYSNDNYNLGMAHGMPGVLSFLSRVHSCGIRQKEIKEMMESAIPWLLLQERKNTVHSFPTAVDVVPAGGEEHPSRLGWCYGDLCIAFALLQCGQALQNSTWSEKGISIALKTTQRTLENAGCTDAPFCHGTTGLIHMYMRLYRHTGNLAFRGASERWLNLTLKHFYKPGKGAGGYFFRTYNEKSGVFEDIPQYSLLEGSAGIALSYLSVIHDIEPAWDKIFFTNVTPQK